MVVQGERFCDRYSLLLHLREPKVGNVVRGQRSHCKDVIRQGCHLQSTCRVREEC